jgi:hypothetical protein
MPLHLLPCTLIRTTTLGSLAIGRPLPYPGFLETQVSSIHHDLLHKPHVHHLNIVDSESEEIVGYAK